MYEKDQNIKSCNSLKWPRDFGNSFLDHSCEIEHQILALHKSHNKIVITWYASYDLFKTTIWSFKKKQESYWFWLPGGTSVSLPHNETELQASPNTNLATE